MCSASVALLERMTMGTQKLRCTVMIMGGALTVDHQLSTMC